MYKHCKKCDKDYDFIIKKCPVCKIKLEKHYTKEELEHIKKENDKLTVINNFFFHN